MTLCWTLKHIPDLTGREGDTRSGAGSISGRENRTA